MQLWSGPSTLFVTETTHNRIAELLRSAFFRHFRYYPSPTEVASWQNSLRATSLAFREAGLDDHGVILEYQLPLSSRRLDCLVCGIDEHDRENAVIIELKQWQACSASAGDNLLCTWLGGAEREILHPSAQVGQYQLYLQDTHTAFHEGPEPIRLSSCAYLHNYTPTPGDAVLAPKFTALLRDFPVFTATGAMALEAFLREKLAAGKGMPVLEKIRQSRYRPSKKLMEHVAAVIDGQPAYVLIDEQLVVFDAVFASAREALETGRKAVLVIKGGPGTGKSVIALNLMSKLLRNGYNAHYATGSKAFTETLRAIIGARGAVQFKYFNSYGQADANEVDVLICDEAHRLRKTSDNRFTPRARRTGTPQVEEIINAAKLAVFFVDDRQVVRPNEIGSSLHIAEHAARLGYPVNEYQLEAQFRCAGSDGFVNWVNNTLAIEKTANVIWDGNEGFDFRIFGSPEDMDRAIRARAAYGFSARMTAGFCWPWSKERPDGTLVDDVVIGGFRRPWNARHEARQLAEGIPRAQLWAYEPGGLDQIGCVYTAQGFEFDYVGVIFGPDLRYDFESQQWTGHREDSKDPGLRGSGEQFVDLVKNTYRVLLSRGLKGCYVFFMDRDTERFVKSRIEGDAAAGRVDEVVALAAESPTDTEEPFRRLHVSEPVRPYVDCVPLYDLAVAAGGFSDEQQADAVDWVVLPEEFRPQPGMFVARVVGESMNRRIPHGSWCLFRKASAGTRKGKVVLAQHREIQDAETGGHFTVKVYDSEKASSREDSWAHTHIILRPDSSDPTFEPIRLDPDLATDLRVLAELVAVLG